jgi:hypothetical protein
MLPFPLHHPLPPSVVQTYSDPVFRQIKENAERLHLNFLSCSKESCNAAFTVTDPGTVHNTSLVSCGIHNEMLSDLSPAAKGSPLHLHLCLEVEDITLLLERSSCDITPQTWKRPLSHNYLQTHLSCELCL